MQALFEVLSFKGWLDIRDVLIKTLGPVSTRQLIRISITFYHELTYWIGSRDLHPHLRLLGLHDWIDAVRRCRHCQLFRE